MIYQFKNLRKPTPEAQTVGEELENIRKADAAGRLHTQIVVDRARPRTNPLHDHFEWDNDTAAEEHRKSQARKLIGSILEVPEPKKTPIRAPRQLELTRPAFTSLRQDQHGYRRTSDVLEDTDLRIVLVSQAMEDFQRYRRRFAHIRELVDAFTAFELALKNLQSPPPPPSPPGGSQRPPGGKPPTASGKPPHSPE